MEAPHCLKASYRDAQADYAPTELRCYRPGFNTGNTALIEERQLKGVTDLAQAKKALAFMMRPALLRRESYQIEYDWEHLAATHGDRMGRHDALHYRSGRLRLTVFLSVAAYEDPDVIRTVESALRRADGPVRVVVVA